MGRSATNLLCHLTSKSDQWSRSQKPPGQCLPWFAPGTPGRQTRLSCEDVLRAADIPSRKRIAIETGPHKHSSWQTFFLYFYEPGGNRIEGGVGGYLILGPHGQPVIWFRAEAAPVETDPCEVENCHVGRVLCGLRQIPEGARDLAFLLLAFLRRSFVTPCCSTSDSLCGDDPPTAGLVPNSARS
jgi:hypothetical protein